MASPGAAVLEPARVSWSCGTGKPLKRIEAALRRLRLSFSAKELAFQRLVLGPGPGGDGRSKDERRELCRLQPLCAAQLEP